MNLFQNPGFTKVTVILLCLMTTDYGVTGELPVPAAALASMGRADLTFSGNDLVINQTTRQAILNWKSFNIGAENSVQFKQPDSTSVALNNIFQNDPSKILGKLSANGQVYLINQNGFVFGKDSKVDVNTLLVSSLAVTDDTLQRGITKVLGQDGRAALVGSGEVYQKDSNGNFILDASGNKQKVTIQFLEGSTVNTATNGRIIAAAPQVKNAGTLNAPDGQIMLVAGTDKIYLQEASGDPSLRGLIVEVKTGGAVTNSGQINTPRGNTTLMGFAVNQEGRISANTSVSANGSIRLLAREGASVQNTVNGYALTPGSTIRPSDSGDGLGNEAKVTFNSGSQTIATPDTSDKTTAVDAQNQNVSRIEVMGHKIQVQKDALIQSNSGKVSLVATDNPLQPIASGVKNDSQVVIESGAVVDVSGIKNVVVPVSRNVVEVELRSNELKDSPLQKKGSLYGKKIYVDIRKGTPLADISGAVARIERNVAERSTTGGTLDLSAEGGVSVGAGSKLDFSGGNVRYTSGEVQTTQLIRPDGKTVDISNADPNATYLGIAEKVAQKFKDFNITQIFNRGGTLKGLGRIEQAYSDGKSAGDLHIKAAMAELKGEMLAATETGSRQRTPELAPKGGSLSIDLARTPENNQGVNFVQDFSSGAGSTLLSVENPLEIRADSIRASGLRDVSVHTHGRIEIEESAHIDMLHGSKMSLSGGEILAAGSFTSHGGSLALKTIFDATGASTGKVDLASSSRFDLSGIWNNDKPSSAANNTQLDTSPIWKNGGSLSVQAQGDILVESGSEMDVSGGAHRTQDGVIHAGNGGSILLSAEGINGSNLEYSGLALGFAVTGGKGGKLTLASNDVVLGALDDSTTIASRKPLIIDPALLTEGGFQSYNFVSNRGGLQVSPGALADVQVKSRRLDYSAVSRVTGTQLSSFSQSLLEPELTRPAGELTLKLALNAQLPDKNAILNVGKDSLLTTGTGGKISLISDTSIVVEGGISTPAGTIDLHVTPPSEIGELGFLPSQGIWLSESASLSALGVSQTYRDGLGRLRGSVLDGGTVNLLADRGFIEINPSALIDVSGTSAKLDNPQPGPNGSIALVRMDVGSAGGTIRMTAAEGMAVLGNLSGQPGTGKGVSGGTLSFELNDLNRRTPSVPSSGQLAFPSNKLNFEISQAISEATLPNSFEDGVSKSDYGVGRFSANQLTSGGFSNLKLTTPNGIKFLGGVDLAVNRSLDLNAPELVAIRDPSTGSFGDVSLASPYVALGSSFVRPGAAVQLLQGSSNFTVDASLIDVRGKSVLSGFGKASLSSAGDLRLQGIRILEGDRDFKGQLSLAGDLNLTARQIYPTSLSDFKISVVEKSDGKITVAGTGESELPPVLSAAGKLTLEAPSIDQGGMIRAPMGVIDLVAGNSLHLLPGSLTSVSAAGMTIPFGRLQAGLDWIYPLGSQNLLYPTPPEKKIGLAGEAVNIESGANVDVKGGGDLQAFEFLPGPGGSFDRLDPTSAGYVKSFAILPSLANGSAPIDPIETPISALKPGDSVYLSGGAGLKAGNYVLMPAHYALLPGAYLVTPQALKSNIVPGEKLQRADGATVVAGFYNVSGSDIRSPIWSGFAVEKGQRALTRSEFGIQTANAFYAAKTIKDPSFLASTPQDGGLVQIQAQSNLQLEGNILAEGSGKGKAGQLDIAASQISVLSPSDAGQSAGGSIVLNADVLSALNVSSLSLGALRIKEAGKTSLDVKASDVSVGRNVILKGSELLLAAKNKVSIAEGAKISAEGETKGARQQLNVEGDAALVRASTGAQTELFRIKAAGTSGSILVSEGAEISASGSLMLDASSENTLSGTLSVKDASLALGAGRISLGSDSRASGLILSNALLSRLNPSELILSSGSNIGVFGSPSITTKSLIIHSAGLIGNGGAFGDTNLTADNIVLDNRNNVSAVGGGSGSNTLTFNSKTLTLGSGDFSLSGFSGVNLNASQGVKAEGNAELRVGSNLNIRAPFITAGRSSNATVDASGYSLQMTASSDAAKPSNENLGARLTFKADSIFNSTLIDLPSGAVVMDARNGNLTLAEGSSIDVAGRSVSMAGVRFVTDGGGISLSANNGSVNLARGAALALGGANGGTLNVKVPTGRFDWQGTIAAEGANTGSKIDIAVGSSIDLGSLGTLGARLKGAGFTDSVSLEAATGDFNLASKDSLEARMVDLSANQGDIFVAGSVLSQGKNATIDLSAGGQIALADTASLVASGASGAGGRILVDTVSLNPNNLKGVSVAEGAKINVASKDAGSNGSVLFRVARDDINLALTGSVGSSIVGSADTVVEADKVFNIDGTISASLADSWKTDALNFMTSQASQYESTLGLKGEVKAGIFLNAAGDLALDSIGLDLASWHVGDRAGVLTMKSGGSISFLGSLSDGFINNPEVMTLAGGQKVGLNDQLQTINSWSYRILASNDVSISNDHYVRTGAGDIEVIAGRDITLGNAGSAIYTMGKAASTNRYGSLNDNLALKGFIGEYPVQGGSISLNAGRNVIGAVTGQFFDGWLTRAGNWSNAEDHSLETPTAWAVHVGGLTNAQQVAFQQNIGALGGGNVVVTAGADVQNLTVVAPTTGKPAGALANPNNPLDPSYLTNTVQVQGGGDIRIEAGNDIRGGTVFTGRGSAQLKAVGSISASDQTGLGAVLATGAGSVNLSANDRIEVAAALNPTVISDVTSGNYFFTYSPDSAITLKAVSGDIQLQNDTESLVNQLNRLRPTTNRLLFPGLASDALKVYPSTLDAMALQGDIVISRSLVMNPSALGSLNLTAGSDIRTEALNGFVYLTMSDADPELLPSVTNPKTNFDDASRRLQPFGPASLIHAQTPVHKDDLRLAKINAGGSILGKDPLQITLPTGANVQAGLDIKDASFSLQHPNATLSSITAGRDILFTQPRNGLGNLVNSAGQISLAGPGGLLTSAGRNIDLGAAVGIFSTGNTVNSALPTGDGAITVLAGMGSKGPQYAEFAQKYDPFSKAYSNLMTTFVGKLSGNAKIDTNTAQAKFRTLTQAEQNLFLFDILFDEIRQSASKAAKTGKAEDYAQGYTAIDTMFPGAGTAESTYAGDLSLFFSKISTLSGGDVNMIAPGGSVNAGLASSFTGSKQSADLGVVVQADGSINGLVNNDFMVNQSRVFALNGGDITIWSSNGNIDAGRGAKSALTIPPPEVTFDQSGNLKIIYPPAVSGSGIRTAASIGGRPGDVYLAAPKGIVDAGEAGIGGSNITIAATAVLGANNIQVSGTSTGVPSAGASVAIAPAGAAAAATAAANTAESAVNNDTNQAKERNSMADNSLNPLSVDILGFGECGVADVREGKPGCV